MKLGIHAYAWCSEWSNDTLHLIDRVRSLGLDFIELPLMKLESFDVAAVHRKLSDAGLGSLTSTVLMEDTDLTSGDPSVRKKGVSYLKSCVDATAGVGADQLCGVIYSQHVKSANQRPGETEWSWAAEGLREVAEYAAEAGVTLAVEPVNRYETYMLNTTSQAMDLLEQIGMDNVKLHLDTYHMNIEEKSFGDAVRQAGSKLAHLHLCENDRGIPGTGLVSWDDLFKALADIRYDGYAALESFVDVTDNMNTWVWRKLAPDGDTLVKEGLQFIRNMQQKYDVSSANS